MTCLLPMMKHMRMTRGKTGFSKQNQIITPDKTVGKKVLLKYISVLFDDGEIEIILDQAAVMWTSSERCAGQGT